MNGTLRSSWKFLLVAKIMLLHYYFIAFLTRLCFPLQKNKTHYFTLKCMSDMNNQNNLKESLSFNIFESLTSKTYSVEQHAV